MSNLLSSPIEYLTGVSAIRGDLLRKELNIFTFKDLLEHFPFRHVDRSRIDSIASLRQKSEGDYAQVIGKLIEVKILGEKRSRRLVAQLQDNTGTIELVWFQGISWIEKSICIGQPFLVFGRLGFFMQRPQMAHPELEPFTGYLAQDKARLEPVYSTTEKLKAKGLNPKAIAKLTTELIRKISPADLLENLPATLTEKYRLMPRFEAYIQLHFPDDEKSAQLAIRRLKFEELFFAQLSVQLIKIQRHQAIRSSVFEKVGTLFNTFYEKHLPFSLTNAQKRVLKEIRKDLGSGKQMNRLLQGDVGSGKTMVALLSMLLAADNGFQSVLMAPTEILAQQHHQTIADLLKPLSIEVLLLTGSTPAKQRKKILEACSSGEALFVVGTHALIEDQVVFHQLGLAIVDEQHKFGVAQRAKLWKKNPIPPHILVMTATPIPRTLALTLYGDLDYSIIDELPPGRIPITTLHKNESHRPGVMSFIREQIEQGRQAYVIYPLIEESSKLDYENLMKGYEEVKAFFPEPQFWISMVHGKQPSDQKETNMQRFVNADTQIMVATTVIEVGVNVPNATVMVIESAEKFGLSQLHQLRGRVGRGAAKSFCVLLTGNQLSADARARMKIMTETSDGFVIAEKDLELRGPGEMEGTRQSGALQFKLANLVEDRAMLETVKEDVWQILSNDPDLTTADNQPVKSFILTRKDKLRWGKIS